MNAGPSRAARRLQRTVAVGAVAAITIFAAGCGGSDDEEPQGNEQSQEQAAVTTADRFSVAVPYDIEVLDPASGENIAHSMLFGNVSETLVIPEFGDEVAPPEVAPGLAESWEQTDDSTWQFKLREGVKFHNGEPFDAEAVKYTIERYLEPETQAAHASFLNVKEVKVVDPATVDLVTEGPAPDLMRALFDVLIVPPKAAAADNEAFIRKPIGTGPYRITDSSADEVVFEVNPDYWNKDNVTPYGQTVSVQSRPEAATRVAAMQAGEVDVAEDIPLESIEQLPAVKTMPSNENLQVILNATEFGAFQDDKLREAAIVGTNREEIRTSLFGDEYSRSAKCQHAAPAVFGFNPDLEEPPYDAERAKQLVEESDYNGEEIRLLGAAGRYPKGDEALQAIAQQWEQAGMKVNLRIVPSDAWITSLFGEEQGGETVHKGHDAIIVGLSAFALTAIEPLSSGVEDGAQLESFPHESNPEVQPLIEEAKTETDEAKQEELLQQAAEKVCAANSHLFIANTNAVWGVKSEDSPFNPRPDLRSILFEQK